LPAAAGSHKLASRLDARTMTAPSPAYLGIDLGTTNSTASVFDGAQVTSVRNAQGSTLTPSVVRIDARGNVTVGARARRFLDSDPGNTRAEFKRLMGTQHTLCFAASGVARRPQELAAEVLKSIRADVRDQLGFAPDTAVISVPALFEVAQTAATSEAARLAGLSRVEMIQEPVASAIAAGWSADEGDASWLVYDLGGGTFDVTLLSTKDGLLRVVAHDGDNFLGGRDLDAKIADWVLEALERSRGVAIDRADPAHAVALRKLRHAAEEAKIELARAAEAVLALPELFDLPSGPVDVDVVVTREILNRLAAPLVDRSIAVCRRLLQANGSPLLGRVVLVGGPTAMPLLRERVAEALAAPFGEGLDPMTLVAQGAALYAATAHLDARPRPAQAPARGPRVWLQYPAMTPDLSPYVVGKVLDADAQSIVKVVLRRADGEWTSAAEALDGEGAFAIPVSLVARRPNVLHVEGVTKQGPVVRLSPSEITIVHGVTISDPPLSRSVGVALANDRVQVYFERGSPLPMRRTFTLRTVETVSPGIEGFALQVPIVQGEFPLAHLCRLVGSLEIPSRDIKAALPAGASIELTLELDRGGRLAASARVAALDQVFDRVAHLVAPQIPIEELASRADALRARAGAVQADAVRRGMGARVIAQLGDLDAAFEQLERDVEVARGGDADAAEKARRAMLEIDATLGTIDAELAWPALEEDVRKEIAWAVSWMSSHADDAERRVLTETLAAVEKARVARDSREVERQMQIVRRLGWAAYYRTPDAWEHQLEHAASRVAEATDAVRANALVNDGKRAAARGDRSALEGIVRELWKLLPADAAQRRLGHSSGVR
jgi:molecular chaperone DnaK